MLTSEFNEEMGSLIRSLQQKVQTEPSHLRADERDALDYLERAIVALVAMHIQLRRRE